jgi:hypothetical protein
MPAVEPAPGMVPANVQGIEATVRVDSAVLKAAPGHRHGPLPEELPERWRKIKAALDEVRPTSPEQWEDGFHRDQNPTCSGNREAIFLFSFVIDEKCRQYSETSCED